MKLFSMNILLAVSYSLSALLIGDWQLSVTAQSADASNAAMPEAKSRVAGSTAGAEPESANYNELQQRLARGWNTWDVHSITTHVLLPEGLAIHIGIKHNTTLSGDLFLQNVLIGRREADAEQVIPGAHTWNGSYTDARISWKGENWRIQSAHEGGDLCLATPLPARPVSALPPTMVFSVDYLWNLPGTALRHSDFIETRSKRGSVPIYCTCEHAGGREENESIDIPIGGPYFAVEFTEPVGVSTGKYRTLAEIEGAIERQRVAYRQTIETAGQNGPILDGIETTLGWDTIYEPEKQRVISPVSRVWSVDWGGFVLFDWDTFFAATLASIGNRDLAYANTVEILVRRRRRDSCRISRGRADGRASTGRNRRWVRSLSLGFTRNLATAGCLRSI